MSALVAAEIKRATGIPFVVTFHALGRVRRIAPGRGRHASRTSGSRSRTGPSPRPIGSLPSVRRTSKIWSKLYDADPWKIATIPCGFDPVGVLAHRSRWRRRATLGLPTDEPIILQLGRMVPRKGVDNVIRGLARLRRSHGISARLLVVGGESREPDPTVTPGNRPAASHRRCEEGVADAVTFVGSRGRAELRDYYSAADVFVSTPWYEPFGITPVEAMACGTPVIGSAVGGIKSDGSRRRDRLSRSA